MSTKNETKLAGGRPPKYAQEQVRDAVQALVEEGVSLEQIDAKAVKSKLCALHGVSEGINAQSLEGPVMLVLEDLADEEQRNLLKALPDPVAPAVDEILTGMKQDLLLLVAGQNPRYIVAIGGQQFRTLPNTSEIYGLGALFGKQVSSSYKAYRKELAAYSFQAA